MSDQKSSKKNHELTPGELRYLTDAVRLVEFGDYDFDVLMSFVRSHMRSYEDLNLRVSFLKSMVPRLSKAATDDVSQYKLEVFQKHNLERLEKRIALKQWLPLDKNLYQKWVDEFYSMPDFEVDADLERIRFKFEIPKDPSIENVDGEFRFFTKDKVNLNRIWIREPRNRRKLEDHLGIEPKQKSAIFSLVERKSNKVFIHIFDQNRRINTGIVYSNLQIAIESLIRNKFVPIEAKSWRWKKDIVEQDYFTFADLEDKITPIRKNKKFTLEDWNYSEEYGWQETELVDYKKVLEFTDFELVNEHLEALKVEKNINDIRATYGSQFFARLCDYEMKRISSFFDDEN